MPERITDALKKAPKLPKIEGEDVSPKDLVEVAKFVQKQTEAPEHQDDVRIDEEEKNEEKDSSSTS